MQLETIACSNCGAPLQVPPSANFITCNHCQTSLAVHRNDSVSYTEKIARIDKRSQQMAGELAHLRYNDELARIDREWITERQKYVWKGQNGNYSEPTKWSATVWGISATLGGFLCLADTLRGGGNGLIGLVIVGFGFGAAFYVNAKANELTRARGRYLRRRRELSVEQFLPDDMKPLPEPTPLTDATTEPLSLLRQQPHPARRVDES